MGGGVGGKVYRINSSSWVGVYYIWVGILIGYYFYWVFKVCFVYSWYFRFIRLCQFAIPSVWVWMKYQVGYTWYINIPTHPILHRWQCVQVLFRVMLHLFLGTSNIKAMQAFFKHLVLVWNKYNDLQTVGPLSLNFGAISLKWIDETGLLKMVIAKSGSLWLWYKFKNWGTVLPIIS